MSDKELVNRCIQKDPLAWNEFVNRYSGLVHWAIKNRLEKWDYFYQPSDIEEIHQNVFFSLWKNDKLEQVKNHEKIASWLIIVSGNEAVSYFRSQKLQLPPGAISIFEEIIIRDQTLTLADMLPFFPKNPLSEKETEAIVMREIETLAPREKIILKLNTLYGKKYREISEILDMPIGSVSTTLKNIKAALKKRLQFLRSPTEDLRVKGGAE